MITAMHTPPDAGGGAWREFHVARSARDFYAFEHWLFSSNGNVVFADFHAARVFAHRMNVRRDVVRFPERAVAAGELNAMGLIDEVLHLLLAHYRRSNPGVLAEALTAVQTRLGKDAVDAMLAAFCDRFPPLAVYRGELTAAEYLAGSTDGEPHREAALEELLLLWLANANPAFAPFRELFDDDHLRRATAYMQGIEVLEEFFASRPPVAGSGRSVFDELQEPMRASPHSLDGQLDFIRRAWAAWLGSAVYRLLQSLDFLTEERRQFGGFAPGRVEVPSFAGLEEETRAYSPDRDWMPRLVLLAKNAYVWLDQLGRRYGCRVTTLRDIPDEELDRLAGWGISGLWLIGVWERSRASERIKRMMGDEEAVASAYSLLDYRVADDLGGEEAYLDLKERAWKRGIRLSTDMVPNHVGIDSRWVIEHPDWFIGLDRSPFPSYSFTGPDLCEDERVGVHIEDHYWSRSDAAVVFRRADHWTGSERFIYHGNDGTSMPWNDTAQLDYLNPEVREAVIQTILHVARLSPIIRFDAAMTLTKRHYRRLWFPEPGSGGDIPSRAEYGMTKGQFDAAMPKEFWREVVDRVAAEAPDTLLLAEAFWLLEGYFVRTLGMHRVYNSAFMNMLRDERNADYRQLIKSTLEFDPEILKRYVNFMSNPDERTAVDQFGSGDKYFGIATLMSTLPGLPMFGHGQVEGFAEKYGMEFRRPRWDERPDEGLIERHRRQIFPLLHRRWIFAEVENFLLYDLYTDSGAVDENVFAYSNLVDGQRSLVIYHNRYAETRGWIRTSAAVVDRDGGGLIQRTLAEALEIPTGGDDYLIVRDAASALEHIYPCQDLVRQGLYLELGAYALHVFVDFRQVTDDASQQYRRLAGLLGGRGVPSIEDAAAQLLLEPVLEPFRRLVAAPHLRTLLAARAGGDVGAEGRAAILDEMAPVLEDLLAAVRQRLGGDGRPLEVAQAVRADLERLLDLSAMPDGVAGEQAADVVRRLLDELEEDPAWWPSAVAWVLVRRLGAIADSDEIDRARSLFDGWFLSRILREELGGLGLDGEAAQRAVAGVKVLMAASGWHHVEGTPAMHLRRVLEELLTDPATRTFLGVNRYRGVLWFSQETFGGLLSLLLLEAVMDAGADEEALVQADELRRALAAAEEASGYRVADLLDAVSGEAGAAAPSSPRSDRDEGSGDRDEGSDERM